MKSYKPTSGTVFSPLTPMSEQDRVSPYNINTMSTRSSGENKEKYQFGNNLGTNITRILWLTVWRTTNLIWEHVMFTKCLCTIYVACLSV